MLEVSTHLWTGSVVVQAAVGHMVYGPVGIDQVMSKHPVEVFCRQAASDGCKLAEALVLLDEAGPAQHICPQVGVTPP